MRYFLVSYNGQGHDMEVTWGSATIRSEIFINEDDISKKLVKMDDLKKVVIMNIFEFKSEEDYNIYKP